MNPKIILASIGVFLALVCGSGTSIANANGRGEHPRGEVLDGRYNHGRFYPPLGAVRSALPSEYRPYFHGTERFYFSAGVWYAPRGEGFVVVRPPPWDW